MIFPYQGPVWTCVGLHHLHHLHVLLLLPLSLPCLLHPGDPRIPWQWDRLSHPHPPAHVPPGPAGHHLLLQALQTCPAEGDEALDYQTLLKRTTLLYKSLSVCSSLVRLSVVCSVQCNVNLFRLLTGGGKEDILAGSLRKTVCCPFQRMSPDHSTVVVLMIVIINIGNYQWMIKIIDDQIYKWTIPIIL